MRVRNQKFVLLAMVAAMVFLIAACGANFSKNTYRALAIQANAYDAAMSSAGDLYKAGKIDDEVKAKIISAATAFKDSYDNAIDKMVAYEKSPPAAKDAAMQQAKIAAEVVARLFANLQAIVGPLGVELVEP